MTRAGASPGSGDANCSSQGHLDPQLHSSAAPTLEPAGATQAAHPFRDSSQPEVTAIWTRDEELVLQLAMVARTIVGDGQRHHLRAPAQGDPRMARLGMTDHVEQ